MELIMGVDVGQKRDHTAICVTELVYRERVTASGETRGDRHYLVRFLDRLPLGTPYPEIAARLADIAQNAERRSGAGVLELYVDATGVGQPVVDTLRKAAHVRTRSVYFNHGDKLVKEKDFISLGKAHLVSRLQVLLQAVQIHLPQGPISEALVEELLDYEIRVDENAHDRYGAFKVGQHDDLVTALGLTVLIEPLRPVRVFARSQ